MWCDLVGFIFGQDASGSIPHSSESDLHLGAL